MCTFYHFPPLCPPGVVTHDVSSYAIYFSGYKTPVFSEKSAQKAKVALNVASKGFLPKELVDFEVDWFYESLGIEVSHFTTVDWYKSDPLYVRKITLQTNRKRSLLIISSPSSLPRPSHIPSTRINLSLISRRFQTMAHFSSTPVLLVSHRLMVLELNASAGKFSQLFYYQRLTRHLESTTCSSTSLPQKRHTASRPIVQLV